MIASAPGGLQGAAFDSARVGRRDGDAMMAATLAQGRTVFKNARANPKMVDLGRCLSAMGAEISGLGTARSRSRASQALHGADYSVMPDRIETGTYAIAAALAGGEVELVDAGARY